MLRQILISVPLAIVSVAALAQPLALHSHGDWVIRTWQAVVLYP
jgi:hypothetical protein